MPWPAAIGLQHAYPFNIHDILQKLIEIRRQHAGAFLRSTVRAPQPPACRQNSEELWIELIIIMIEHKGNPMEAARDETGIGI